MSAITLNKENCNELIKRYVNTGYVKGRCFTIGDAAMMHRHLNLLTGVEKDESVTDKRIYSYLFKALEVANSNGAFDVNDGAVIYRLIAFVNSDILKGGETVDPPAAQPVAQASKIEEI